MGKAARGDRLSRGVRCGLMLSVTLLVANVANAFSGGISGRAIAPGCAASSCHESNVASLASSGSLSVSGGATELIAGTTYTMTFLNTPSGSAGARAGFNLGDNLSNGVFSTSDSNTQIQLSGDEVGHNTMATGQWDFQWTVPESGSNPASVDFQWCTMRVNGADFNVNDGPASCDSQTFSLAAPNEAPTANAGPDQSVDEGVVVTLDGSGSTDAPTDTLSYQWVRVSGASISLNGAATISPTFTAPLVGVGGDSVVLRLTVTDDGNLSDTDDVTVTLNNLNQTPSADAGVDRAVGEGSLVTLDGSGSSDPDSGETASLTYSWQVTAGANVSLNGAATQTPSFTAPSVGPAGGSTTVQLTVTDVSGATDSDSVVVTFTDSNVAPVANAGSDQQANEGSAVSLDGSGSTDDNIGTVSYRWTQVSGPTIAITGSTSATAGFTAPEVGFSGNSTVVVNLLVTDAEGSSSNDQAEITVVNQNNPPAANAGSDSTVAEGVTVNLDGTASSDPDTAQDDVLSFAWTVTGGFSVTLTNANTATPTFTSPSAPAPGASTTLQLVVTDLGNVTDTDIVVVTYTADNASPVANAGADQTVNEGAAVSLDGTGSTDDDLPGVSFSWAQVSGPVINLSGATTSTAGFVAPQVGFTGNASIVLSLTVTDAESLVNTDQVIVNVTNVNQPPTAVAGSNTSAGEGVTVMLNGTASSDPDTAQDDVLSFAWTVTGGLDVTLANANTATPTFTSPSAPAPGASTTIQLVVTDLGNATDSATVVVTYTADNTSPVANAGENQMVNEGVTVSLDGTGSTDDDLPGVSFSWAQASGPVVSLTGSTTSTVGFVAPQVGFDGNTPIVLSLTVTDAQNLADTDQVTVNVTNVNQPPVASAGADQLVSPGANVVLSAGGSTDPDTTQDDTLSFAWEQQAGPAVVLNGANSASPDFTVPIDPGATPLIFQLTVTDRGAVQASDTVTVTISADNSEPMANAGSDQSVIEGAYVSLDGSASADADGPLAGFSWTQLFGPSVNVPVSDEATLSFTAPPVELAGAVLDFQLTVTDADGNTAIDTVTVTVEDDAEAPMPVAAVLPGSRSVSVGGAASAFATILNPTPTPLSNCRIVPVTNVASDFSFRTTDPTTNAVIGAENVGGNVPAEGSLTYVFVFTPTAAISPTDVELAFQCDDAQRAPVANGVNRFLLSAETGPVTDVIALVATSSANGILQIPGPAGVEALGIASVNVGASGNLTVMADTGDATLPVDITLCRTNPVTGGCLAPAASTVALTANALDSQTYTAFVQATGDIPLDPSGSRIRLLFMEAGVIRGVTSVAVTTSAP